MVQYEPVSLNLFLYMRDVHPGEILKETLK